jgi:hypothetical protein
VEADNIERVSALALAYVSIFGFAEKNIRRGSKCYATTVIRENGRMAIARIMTSSNE